MKAVYESMTREKRMSEVVRLRKEEGKSVREIADRVGVSYAVVYNCLHTASVALRKCDGQQGCSVKGCIEKHKGLGFCSTHFTRFRKHGDP